MIPDGARVEYTGKGMMLSKNRLGQQGTVLSSYTRWSSTFRRNEQVVKVDWDGAKTPQSVFACNVEWLDNQPKWEL